MYGAQAPTARLDTPQQDLRTYQQFCPCLPYSGLHVPHTELTEQILGATGALLLNLRCGITGRMQGHHRHLWSAAQCHIVLQIGQRTSISSDIGSKRQRCQIATRVQPGPYEKCFQALTLIQQSASSSPAWCPRLSGAWCCLRAASRFA
jgi:hypothetical protein